MLIQILYQKRIYHAIYDQFQAFNPQKQGYNAFL